MDADRITGEFKYIHIKYRVIILTILEKVEYLSHTVVICSSGLWYEIMHTYLHNYDKQIIHTYLIMKNKEYVHEKQRTYNI